VAANILPSCHRKYVCIGSSRLAMRRTGKLSGKGGVRCYTECGLVTNFAVHCVGMY
jgi:hypothetical protein